MINGFGYYVKLCKEPQRFAVKSLCEILRNSISL